MLWSCKELAFDLASRPLVMGIVNVTEDSFSDGGLWADPADAVAHALRLAAEGADILDIGGASSRPGAEPVPEAAELARVLPVIRALAGQTRCAISIDTSKPAVAAAALDAGAHIINDIAGLSDPAMMDLATRTGAGAVIMHMQGTPRTMQQAPVYEDVTREIRDFFRQSYARAISCGMKPEQIAFDPGIGFGKTLAHNLTLIKNTPQLRVHDRPILLGVSRKGFLGKIADAPATPAIKDRVTPTVAITAMGVALGVNIFRVHDVLENVRAMKTAHAVLTAP